MGKANLYTVKDYLTGEVLAKGTAGELEASGVGLGGKGAGNHHRSGGNLESRVLQRKTPVN